MLLKTLALNDHFVVTFTKSNLVKVEIQFAWINVFVFYGDIGCEGLINIALLKINYFLLAIDVRLKCVYDKRDLYYMRTFNTNFYLLLIFLGKFRRTKWKSQSLLSFLRYCCHLWSHFDKLRVLYLKSNFVKSRVEQNQIFSDLTLRIKAVVKLNWFLVKNHVSW